MVVKYFIISLQSPLFSDAPIKPKKQKQQDSHKLKQIITKTVNKAMEDELRLRAGKGKLELSNAQQVVAKYNSGQLNKE